MATPLVYGQPITKEAVQAARVPGGGFLRDEGAVEVYVKCNTPDCPAIVKTWITPKYDTCPPVYCEYCEWEFENPRE